MTSKVLIIKTGFSETFDPEVSETVSLGDVFTTTMILHAFKGCDVTWLTARCALPLLENNPRIDRILFYDLTSVLQLKSEIFGSVVNLEKVPGLCALADSIDTSLRYGFAFDPLSGTAKVCARSRNVDPLQGLRPYMSADTRKEDHRFWPEVLFEAVGRKWDGEDCLLEREPRSDVEHDVGLNYRVGPKWPNKAWPYTRFMELEGALKESGYSVSWQKGEKDIREYIDWIDSCDLIVTNDSLGMHLAIALRKKVVGLFGPTSMHPRYLGESGRMVSSGLPSEWEGRNGMEGIPMKSVLGSVEDLMS